MRHHLPETYKARICPGAYKKTLISYITPLRVIFWFFVYTREAYNLKERYACFLKGIIFRFPQKERNLIHIPVRLTN